MTRRTGSRRQETDDPAKRLGRRAALRLLGASLPAAAFAGGVSRPAAAPATASHARAGTVASRLRPLATGTAPRAVSADLFATLAAAVDLIIPETDTPGARAAGVHWYLDDAASADQGFLAELTEGLRRLDARARARDGKPFADLPSAEQTQVLTAISDLPDAAADATPVERRFFALLKARTIDAYYRSEIGQIGELEWVGHEFYDEFPGACTHADPLRHPRPSWPRARS